MKVGCLARLSEMKTVYGGVLQYMLLEGGDYDVDETHDRCGQSTTTGQVPLVYCSVVRLGAREGQ